ncbi:MAG: OmpH family outer membrane protein [Porphyromonadaceae bacterium]|nr:OmpH family outer membrane protein [Porphyromonadaceae bacterium]
MNTKNLSLILNIILLIAVIILFILVLGDKKGKQISNVDQKKDSVESKHLPIAYVNIDSLLLNYTFAKNANEELISKQENSRATLNSRARQLQNEMDEFNRKLENNAFLSRERAEDAQRSILKKQQDLQQLEGNLTKQLMEQQEKMNNQLRDTIQNFFKDYNKNGKYEMIISNTANDNVLFSKETYDITSDVINQLNARVKK